MSKKATQTEAVDQVITYSPLVKLIKTDGVPMRRVVLKDNVETHTGTPENAFYDKKSATPNRKASIWMSPSMVYIEQIKAGGHVHGILLPASTVKDANPA